MRKTSLEGIDIALDKQIHIYSVDTSAFYNDSEYKIHRRLNKNYKFRNYIRKQVKKKNCKYSKDKLNNYLVNINKRIKIQKNKLYEEFKKHTGLRTLRPEYLNDYNIISIFESTLTRTMQIPEKTLSLDLIVVQTYFFDVIEDIILDGFLCNREKYVCFTASAGQIRTKKTVFIKESSLIKYRNSLMCGLTIDKINKLGGVNINKYLAYLALCNSATDLWKDFDIRKSIVVDDMETLVNGTVDFIDDKTYEIERKTMDIPICHTDGCGMILPRKSKKNFMIRLPWIKGLLVSFPYDKFIELHGCSPKIKDIYGTEHNIWEEDIEVIFTKSQFKMWKYYSNWNDYVQNFLKYNCQAGICNEEEDEFSNAKINYQMLQTLSDMTEDELKIVCDKTIKDINNISSDKKTMFKVFGVNKYNKNRTYLQQALELYPQLISDTYTKEILRQIKKSMVKDGRSGRFEIDGTYTFIIPDLYAFCEYLFLGIKNPKGLLKNKEVYCNIYNQHNELACLRSPHLYREWAIRNNVCDEEKAKWFITNGLYTSCHDLISKVLQFDVDGDKSLVCAEKVLIDVAKRNMEGIVPLYYNMSKAGSVHIDSQTIYNGLKYAYVGGNIGLYSNDITKIWNSENINLDVIKLLCMENNFTIDYAKTLYKPERPKHIKRLIVDYTKYKVPHFFIYAKDKEVDQVEKINNSTVNKLYKIIPNPNINFKIGSLDGFDYTLLMNDKNIEINDAIVKKYKELDLKKYLTIKQSDDEEYNNFAYLYQQIRKNILELNSDIYYVTDVLVKYLYHKKNSKYKETLWQCFGDVIVDNLKRNIDSGKYIYCKKCGRLVEKGSNRHKYCNSCWKEINREQIRNRVRKNRM